MLIEGYTKLGASNTYAADAITIALGQNKAVMVAVTKNNVLLEVIGVAAARDSWRPEDSGADEACLGADVAVQFIMPELAFLNDGFEYVDT